MQGQYSILHRRIRGYKDALQRAASPVHLGSFRLHAETQQLHKGGLKDDPGHTAGSPPYRPLLQLL